MERASLPPPSLLFLLHLHLHLLLILLLLLLVAASALRSKRLFRPLTYHGRPHKMQPCVLGAPGQPRWP
eukprot:380733-Pyramimonas_sp.AAC.1